MQKIVAIFSQKGVYKCQNVKAEIMTGSKMDKTIKYCKINFAALIDKNILFQQNISNYNLILVVFDSESSKIEELIQFVLLFNLRVQEFQKKNWYIIKKEQ